MATTILNQLKKTLEDEGEKKEFMKLYQQLCSQVDYNACAHMDTIVQKVNQEAHQEIHRIVEEKIRPKEQQILKLKRENDIARMVIQRHQEEHQKLLDDIYLHPDYEDTIQSTIESAQKELKEENKKLRQWKNKQRLKEKVKSIQY